MNSIQYEYYHLSIQIIIFVLELDKDFIAKSFQESIYNIVNIKQIKFWSERKKVDKTSKPWIFYFWNDISHICIYKLTLLIPFFL